MDMVYALQRLQLWLPLNPQAMASVSPDSAFNTAVSFVTNTNWQGYGGESTMGYLTQMLGLTVQNFLSAATGIVVVIALIRGFARHSAAASAMLGRPVPHHHLDPAAAVAGLRAVPGPARA
jgi:K+-transporting ATPase ATPase A chain